MQSIRGARRRERSRRGAAVIGSLARARAARIHAAAGQPEPKQHGLKINGQALAEFALILPVFVFLLLLAVDFGRVFFTYIQLNNAAREAAAYAAGQVGNEKYDAANVLVYAQQETNTQGQTGPGGVTVNVTCETPSGGSLDCTNPDVQGAPGIGNTVTVKVNQDFTFLTPFIGDMFGAPLTMTASSTAAINGNIAGKGTAPGTCGTPPIAVIYTPVVPSGLDVNLDGSWSTPMSGSCQITGYTWELGDGNVVQDPSDVHIAYTYANPGTYTIQLTVTNPAGESHFQTTVTVGSGPAPSSSPTPTLPPTPVPTPTVVNTSPTCNTMPGFSYQFTGSGDGQNAHRMTFYGSYTGQPAPASWSWNFGETGSSGNGVTASNKYKAGGLYTVTLTVKNGNCVAVTSQVVVVP